MEEARVGARGAINKGMRPVEEGDLEERALDEVGGWCRSGGLVQVVRQDGGGLCKGSCL